MRRQNWVAARLKIHSAERGPINVPYFSLSSCLTFGVHFNLVAGFFCHRVFLSWFSVMLDAIVDFGVTNGPAARTYWT